MNRFHSILFLLLVTTSTLFGQNCLPDGIKFSNQQSIDDFSINYPNCTIIEGDVEIGITSSILNLEGLNQIKRIGGNFRMILQSRIESLEGLNNLEEIGGDFYLDTPGKLASFAGLENLQSIGGTFQVFDNNTITNLKGLERLKTIGKNLSFNKFNALKSMSGLDSLQFIGGSLGISASDSLLTFDGFERLEKVGGSITVSTNKMLQKISGFNKIDSLGSKITINSNNSLLEVAGFGELIFIGGELEVRFNPILEEITAFTKLKSIGGLSIGANDQLKNLNSLESLKTIDGNFSLSNNKALNSIAGLKSLTTVNGVFSLNNHNQLLDLKGLENLTFIKRWLSIDRNAILNSLAALSNLAHITEGFSISYAPRLNSLNGLENIPAADGVLYLNNNDSLTDISAITNLLPTSITELQIRENPQLGFCDIKVICEFLAQATDELIIIENNATGCLDRTTVSNQCEIDFEAPLVSNKTVDWNWTSHLKRTSEFAQTYPTDIFHDSKNNSYVVGIYGSNTHFNDQILAFSDRVGVDNNSFIAKYDLSGNLVWTKNENIGSRVLSATIDDQDIIHVFATDSIRFTNTYFYEQYDTDWNQISSIPLLNYTINGGAFTRHQIEIDGANNPYFIFRGDGFGTINFTGFPDTLELPKAHNYWLLKYTPEGELAWLDTIRSDGFSNRQMQIDFNDQNELAMAGTYTGNFSAQGKTLSGRRGSSTHIFCLQYDNQGTIKWAKTIGENIRTDYCNDLEINDNQIYLTGTLGFGDYILGENSVSVLRNDPFIFKLDQNGEVADHLVLPLNINTAKGSSIAFNAANELVWIGKYSGKNALIGETFLPHEADFTLQENTFLLTIDQSEGLQVESIHTYPANGGYDISHLVPLGDSAFLVAGYFSVDITLGDTLFKSDFLVTNRYDAFIGAFGVVDTGITATAYTTFPTQNGIWKTLESRSDNYGPNVFGYIQKTRSHFMQGDTTINDLKYHKIYTTQAENIPEKATSEQYHGAFRESDKVVYYFYKNRETETILYDFNLSVGDTIITIADDVGFRSNIYVSSIDSVQQEGNKFRKRYNLMVVDIDDMVGTSPAPTPRGAWVEGIGDINKGLFSFPFGISVFDGANKFQCFSLGDTLVYDNPTINSCYTDQSEYRVEYTPLVVKDATWIQYDAKDGYEIAKYFGYKILTDTIISEVAYHQLVKYDLEWLGGDKFELLSERPMGYIREDKIAKKIYFYDGNDPERIIADFSKGINDQFDHYLFNSENEVPSKIVTDTIEFRYDQYRRVLKNEEGIELIEGIGYTTGLLELPSTIIQPNGYYIIEYCRDINFSCNILTATSDPLSQKVTIYPNPTKDFLSIRFEQIFDGQIELHSLAGQVVYQTDFNSKNHKIIVADLSKGVYFLHLQSEEGYLVQKIVIQ